MSAALNAAAPATVPQKLSARLVAIEARRRGLKISVEALALAAAIHRNSYRRAIRGLTFARPTTLRKLEAGLSALRNARRLEAEPEAQLIRATYGGFLVAVASAEGVDPGAVHAQDPRRGATACPHWRRIAQVRQAAIYLTNTVVDVKQRRLAEVLGLTPAAICLGLKSVEDRRDDPAFDRLLDRLAGDVMGGTL